MTGRAHAWLWTVVLGASWPALIWVGLEMAA